MRNENAIFSKGFSPTISTVTHEKPGCKPSCIDNFITNNNEIVIMSGTIPNSKSNCNAKHTQYYMHFRGHSLITVTLM